MGAKKKSGGSPAVCAKCYELIDWEWLREARRNPPVVHGCGRVLIR